MATIGARITIVGCRKQKIAVKNGEASAAKIDDPSMDRVAQPDFASLFGKARWSHQRAAPEFLITKTKRRRRQRCDIHFAATRADGAPVDPVLDRDQARSENGPV